MAGKRIVFFLLGVIATLLGLLGVWLPGLPTVPFIIVALWAFAESSEKAHRWLKRLPLLASAIQEAENFKKNRTISLRVKLIAQISAWTSFLLVAVVMHSITISMLVGMLATACSIVMFIIPTSKTQVEVDSE